MKKQFYCLTSIHEKINVRNEVDRYKNLTHMAIIPYHIEVLTYYFRRLPI